MGKDHRLVMPDVLEATQGSERTYLNLLKSDTASKDNAPYLCSSAVINPSPPVPAGWNQRAYTEL